MRPLLRTTALAALGALALSSAGAQQPQGREQTADQQVIHALNRLAFGPRPGEVARVRAMGVDRWIAQQLAPATIPDSAMTVMLAGYSGIAIEPAESMELYREQVRARRVGRRATGDGSPADSAAMQPMERQRAARNRAGSMAGRELAESISDVAAAKLARAVVSERQLQEMMADFWANHFSIARNKGQTRLHIAHYDRDVIRPHAMGNFRELLGAVAKSPAMLFYLDNARSVAEAGRQSAVGSRQPSVGDRQPAVRSRPAARSPQAGPAPVIPPPSSRRGLNENYARELLELHTLGVDGGYTQQDVMEVARALTGWSIDQRRGEFVFRRGAHDRGAKQVLGARLPAGRGIEDGEQVLDIVARHPATARHIARKLVVRFVSDSPPPALVERAAATFTRTDGDITETLRTIVTSDEFFSQAAWRAKVKTPFELVASTYRALGQVPDTTPRAALLVGRLGQPIYGRQTPDGWPDTADEWMNAGAILNRINFGLLVAGGRVPGIRLQDWPAYDRLQAASCGNSVRGCTRDSVPHPSSLIPHPERAVDVIAAELLGGAMSVETREILMSGANPLLERATPPAAGASSMPARAAESADGANEMTGRAAAPDTPAAVSTRGLQLTPLQQLVGLALGSPEFQRR